MNNTYTFSHKDFENNTEVVYTINNAVTSEEIVRAFKYFLQGVSFHEKTIRQGFQIVSDEMESEDE